MAVYVTVVQATPKISGSFFAANSDGLRRRRWKLDGLRRGADGE